MADSRSTGSRAVRSGVADSRASAAGRTPRGGGVRGGGVRGGGVRGGGVRGGGVRGGIRAEVCGGARAEARVGGAGRRGVTHRDPAHDSGIPHPHDPTLDLGKPI
ncbi:hypothetical protein GCM10009660_26540 [Catellatospora bangladeshensis]